MPRGGWEASELSSGSTALVEALTRLSRSTVDGRQGRQAVRPQPRLGSFSEHPAPSRGFRCHLGAFASIPTRLVGKTNGIGDLLIYAQKRAGVQAGPELMGCSRDLCRVRWLHAACRDRRASLPDF
jgi:hypothetical protein